jgi:hypothetical protein
MRTVPLIRADLGDGPPTIVRKRPHLASRKEEAGLRGEVAALKRGRFLVLPFAENREVKLHRGTSLPESPPRRSLRTRSSRVARER